MPIPNPSSNHLRITNAGKTPGAFLTAQIISPPNESQLAMGKIYAVLEIKNPTTSTRQVGQTIINTLKRAYFKGTSTSDLQNFEKALKAVNETLAQIVQSGESNWIGNLDATFCLLINNEAHLAATGRAQTWLIREGKISEIVDSQTQPLQPHPLKTFSSVTSGSLVSGDRIILASPKLGRHLSSQNIKTIISGASLAEAGENLIKTLKTAKEKAVSLLVIEAPSKEPSSPSQDIDLYLDQPIDSALNRAVKFSKKYLAPWAARASRQTVGYFKSGVKLTRTKIIPSSRSFLKTASSNWRTKSRELAKNYTATAAPKIQQLQTKAKQMVAKKLLQKPAQPEEMYPGANIIGRSIYTINDYRANHPVGARKILKQIISLTKKTLYHLDNQLYHLKSWLLKRKKRPLTLIAGVLGLIVILIVSVSFQRQKQAERALAEQQKQTLETSRKKLEEGKTALIFTDKETAALLFEEAIGLAEKLSGTEYQDSAQEIIEQAIKESDGLTATTRIREVKPFAEDLSARLLFAYQGNAFVLTAKNPSIIKVNILSGNKNTINQIEADKGAWRQAIKASDEHFYLLTDKGNIYDFNLKDESIKLIGLKDEQLKKAADLSIFDDNLYLLSPEDSQIWKYQPAEDGGFQNPIKYSQTSLAKILSQAKALAIDGAVYVLSGDEIVKISRGTRTDFKIRNLAKPFSDLSQAVDIFTTESIPSIYLLDKTKPRIIELDKNGNYLHQYLFPLSFKNLQSFQVDHIGKKAWILADDRGYEVDL